MPTKMYFGRLRLISVIFAALDGVTLSLWSETNHIGYIPDFRHVPDSALAMHTCLLWALAPEIV